MSKIETTIAISKTAANAIATAYGLREKDLAAQVVTLAPFTGKGHTADTVVASVAEHGIDAAAQRSTIANALGNAREMAKRGHLGKGTTATASARDGIAVAIAKIRRAPVSVGGGADGVTAAYDLAVTGTDNPAEVAERLTAAAETVEESYRASRRAKSTRAARPAKGDAETAKADADADAPTKGKGTAKADGKGDLAPHSVRALLAEINARVVAGYVLTLEESALFDELAVNVEESAMVDAA